jgi:hypothetical protein
MQAAARNEEAKKPVDPTKPVVRIIIHFVNATCCVSCSVTPLLICVGADLQAEAVNKTGGVETDDGRTLFGLDAEIYLKLKAKEDPDWERKIGAWIQTVRSDVVGCHVECDVGLVWIGLDWIRVDWFGLLYYLRVQLFICRCMASR